MATEGRIVFISGSAPAHYSPTKYSTTADALKRRSVASGPGNHGGQPLSRNNLDAPAMFGIPTAQAVPIVPVDAPMTAPTDAAAADPAAQANQNPDAASSPNESAI